MVFRNLNLWHDSCIVILKFIRKIAAMKNNLETTKNVNYWNHRSHEYAELFYESKHRVEVMMRLSSLLPKKISSLLDLGCGNGIVTEYILNNRQKKPDLVHLLDFAPEMLKLAKERLNDYNAFYYEMPMEYDLPFRDDSVDCIISCFALHHVNDDDKFRVFQNLYRVVANNGVIVIADEIIFADHLDDEVPSDLMMKLFYPNKNETFFSNTFSDLVEYPSRIDILQKMIIKAGFTKYFFQRFSDISGVIVINK